MATFAIGDKGGGDKIKNYQKGRYISSNYCILSCVIINNEEHVYIKI